MSVKPNRRLLRSTAFDEETSTSLMATLSSKRPKKIRRTDDLTYFSPDVPSKNSNNNAEVTDKSLFLKQKSQKAPKRKIIRAKRLLTSGTVKSEDAHVEETTFLKEKRKTLEKQKNIDIETLDLTTENDKDLKIMEETLTNQLADNMLHFEDDEEIKNESGDTTFVLNEKECKKNGNKTKETLFEEKITDNHKEKKLNNKSDLTITTLKNPISPSTSSEDLNIVNVSPEDGKSSFEHLQFNSSPENLHPSTSGCVEESSSRRRTFELENSVNDISLLKVLSMSDSARINSFPSEEECLSSPAAASASKPYSKVTLRKRWAQNDSSSDRISKISPPWSVIGGDSVSTPLKKTPEPVKKSNSMLKRVLSKESAKSSTGRKLGSTVKIPNFAAIHQRNFEKMESLSEYKQRKEERAKMLLSGRKPVNNRVKEETPKKQSKKQLRFAASTADKKHSLTYIPLPSTPAPKQFMNKLPSLPSTPIAKQSVNKLPSESPTIKMPLFNFTKGKENPFTLLQQPSVAMKIQNGISKSKVPIQVKIVGLKNTLEQRRPFHLSNNELNTKKIIHKKEEIKMMVTSKSKPLKRSLEKKRDIIKGVRSNRRFELLMNMRKGK